MTAFEFTKVNVPHACKQILALQVKYKLVDPSKLQNSVKNSTLLSVYFYMCKLGNSDSIGSSTSVDATSIFNAITADNSGSQENMRRGSVMIPSLPIGDRAPLLLELARICFQLDCIGVAEKCIAYLNKSCTLTDKIEVQGNFLKCELKVRKLNEQEIFTKHNIDARLKAITSLEEHLLSAAKKFSDDESLIQTGCVLMWNLCLPLLQTNLRKAIGSQLATAVQLLDEMDSLLLSLRCQLHFEVAKCEEDKEQLQSAIVHLMRALELDDVGSFKPQVFSFFVLLFVS